MMKARILVRGFAALFVLAAIAAAGPACGGAEQPAGSMKVTMTEFKFDPSSVDTKAGKVVLFVVNSGTVSHDLVVHDSAGAIVAQSSLVPAGNSAVLTIDNLPAGSYTIICSVAGHADSGMKGTLTASP